MTDATTRYAVGDEGTVWPIVPSYDDTDSVDWLLRYNPDRLTRADQLWLASVVSAYRALTHPHAIAPRAKFANARRAVRVWHYPQAGR